MPHTLKNGMYVRCTSAEQMKELAAFAKRNNVPVLQALKHMDNITFRDYPLLLYNYAGVLINHFITITEYMSGNVKAITPEQFKNHCLGL